jgi:prepilin-type N-terminal cleavage/methylation domain
MGPILEKKDGVAGFTLLEVMIALSILAAISLSIFAVTSQTVNSKGSTEERDEIQHSVTLALSKISDDLNMAFIVTSKDLLGSDFDGDYGFQGSEERVDFVSFSHQRYIENARESDTAEISYFLAPMPDEPGMRALMRRESPSIDKNLQEGGEAVVLLEGVENIKFEYYDEKSKEFKRAWDTRSVDFGAKLPAAVRVTLELKLPEEEDRTSFTTWIPVELFRGPVTF